MYEWQICAEEGEEGARELVLYRRYQNSWFVQVVTHHIGCRGDELVVCQFTSTVDFVHRSYALLQEIMRSWRSLSDEEIYLRAWELNELLN